MSTERQRLLDRRDLVQRDIEELAEQIADGEVDEEVGRQLMEGYQADLAEVTTALGKVPEPKPKQPAKTAKAVEPPAPPRRSPLGIVVVGAVVIATLSAAIFLAARDATPDEPAASGAASPGALTVDPNTVSNEQLEAVVAENPDIPAMRLALAERYFMAGQFGEALEHYLYIAEASPNPAEQAVALLRIGRMAYASGRPQDAEDYVMQSLAIDPDLVEAKWFVGFNTLYGLDDPARAIPQLETAMEIPGLESTSIAELEQAIAEARQRLES